MLWYWTKYKCICIDNVQNVVAFAVTVNSRCLFVIIYFNPLLCRWPGVYIPNYLQLQIELSEHSPLCIRNASLLTISWFNNIHCTCIHCTKIMTFTMMYNNVPKYMSVTNFTSERQDVSKNLKTFASVNTTKPLLCIQYSINPLFVVQYLDKFKVDMLILKKMGLRKMSEQINTLIQKCICSCMCKIWCFL